VLSAMFCEFPLQKRHRVPFPPQAHVRPMPDGTTHRFFGHPRDGFRSLRLKAETRHQFSDLQPGLGPGFDTRSSRRMPRDEPRPARQNKCWAYGPAQSQTWAARRMRENGNFVFKKLRSNVCVVFKVRFVANKLHEY
jgi:hypothetical protein